MTVEATNFVDNIAGSQSTLIIVLVINVLLILGLLFFIFRQNKHIDQLEAAMKPKYGFLGKPLLSVMAVLMMVGSFVVIYAVSENASNISVGGNDQIELQIEVKPGAQDGDMRAVHFQVIPKINGVEWGGEQSGAVADVFWSISGAEEFSEFEINLSYAKPGGFTRSVSKGTYQVRVDFLYLGQTYTSTINVGI